MEKTRKIFVSPIAIALAVAHLFLFVFSLFYEKPQQIFSNYYSTHAPEPVLFNWLLYINMPSIWILEIFVQPVLDLFGKNLLTLCLSIFIFVILSGLQWFLVGFLVSMIVELFRRKEVKSTLR